MRNDDTKPSYQEEIESLKEQLKSLQAAYEELKQQYAVLFNSYTFRIGKLILTPLILIINLFVFLKTKYPRILLKTTIKLLDFFAIRRTRSLLLVKLDSIGDYILLRNFIEILKNDKEYGKYNITLCGNIIWKELAETFDKDYIKHFIWVDQLSDLTSRKYHFSLYCKIHLFKYDLLIHPTYSRCTYSEEIIGEFRAKKKISTIGDLTNITPDKKQTYDRMYQTLLPAIKSTLFEFYRNKEFFEALLGSQIDISKPVLTSPNWDLPKIFIERKKYVVIFPRAGTKERNWNEVFYAEIADYIISKYNHRIVLAGSKNDKPSTHAIRNMVQKEIIDLAGETTIPELISLIFHSEFLISPDTSAIHIAAAFNKPSICISNGNYFGRFIPYPSNIFSNAVYIYPDLIEKKLHEYDLLCKFYRNGSKVDINLITPSKVIENLQKIYL